MNAYANVIFDEPCRENGIPLMCAVNRPLLQLYCCSNLMQLRSGQTCSNLTPKVRLQQPRQLRHQLQLRLQGLPLSTPAAILKVDPVSLVKG